MTKERNGSDQILKTYMWGQNYVDELIKINAGLGPITASHSPVWPFWAMQDANYNVIGIVNKTGRQVERYEYTPYGERTVYGRQDVLTNIQEETFWFNDAMLTYPQLTSARISWPHPVTLCDFGFQGKMHDTVTGQIYGVARMINAGRFSRRDPEKYIDGMNLYEHLGSNPITRVDPSGTSFLIVPTLVAPTPAQGDAGGWWVALEANVTGGPLRINNAYNLRLWESTRGIGKSACILYVKMTLQFKFKKGTRDWASEAEKRAWMNNYVSAIESAWSNQHRIILAEGDACDCKCPNGTQVKIQITPLFEGIHVSEHWALYIERIKDGGFQGSSTNTSFGSVKLDSEDLTPWWKGTDFQRGAMHEFGHMLGLSDEYNVKGGVTHWLKDTGSVMHSGDAVRPHHYTPFSEWITDKAPQPKKGEKCKYAVQDGKKNWTYENAGIHN